MLEALTTMPSFYWILTVVVAGLQFAMVASMYYISVTLNFPISMVLFLTVVQVAHWTQDFHAFNDQNTIHFYHEESLYQQAG